MSVENETPCSGLHILIFSCTIDIYDYNNDSGESTSSLPDDGWDEDESDEDDSGGYQDYYRSYIDQYSYCKLKYKFIHIQL